MSLSEQWECSGERVKPLATPSLRYGRATCCVGCRRATHIGSTLPGPNHPKFRVLSHLVLDTRERAVSSERVNDNHTRRTHMWRLVEKQER